MQSHLGCESYTRDKKKVPSKLLRKCLFSLWSRGIRNTSLFATWVNHPAQDDHISGQDSEKEQQPTILRIYTAAAYTIFWWLKTASAERMMQDLTKTVCLLFSVKNSRLNCLVMTSVFTEPSTCTSRLRLHACGTVFFLLFFFLKAFSVCNVRNSSVILMIEEANRTFLVPTCCSARLPIKGARWERRAGSWCNLHAFLIIIIIIIRFPNTEWAEWNFNS